MNAALDNILSHYRRFAASADYAGLPDSQQTAAAALHRLPLPTRRDESWRYTPLPAVLEHPFQPIALEDDLLTPDDVEQLRLTPADSPRVVMLNGFFIPELSTIPDDGSVEILPLNAALRDLSSDAFTRIGQLSGTRQHLFTALNTASLGEGVYVRVSAGTVLAKPLEVLHVSISFESEFIAQPRLLVVLEAGAQATLVEQYAHLSDTLCLNNGVVEVFLEAGAQLSHPRLQHESLRTRHLSSLYLRQAAESHYQGTTLAFGGAWSRTEFHVDFSGTGAHCDLNGFYLAGDKQSHGMHVDVIHNLPNCTSRERFKGILYGNSTAVFDGNILVQADAQKTDARLSNDNLLLSRDAEINTKPRLEIYADDVQCSHGTTVGQLDPEMLFYLRARGIPHEQAVTMICMGFAGAIIATCEFETLEQCANALLVKRLSKLVGLSHQNID
ncbi:Iron-regulated ABC transporter permease protein SufD [Thiothrix caldifontis]|uniref:Iron-regulated ABC transporter permease protein SufD n=1 Tax=Thiothrix caldifontis TaxID=525918 RepID=A0A1H4G5G7_9GAMM|nr:Fe-S cluster assembly protein SufD [Thiothrix caldifontis]SEB04158.1 Iron-regulated ABC transporter permease protein SufD [Thiothrix caldifontis]